MDWGIFLMKSEELKRCFGGGKGKEFYACYHDEEWGMPEHDDRALFEKLILDGAQAGLSWEIILKKREGYRRVFHGFEIERVANMTDTELETALQDEGIVRNRLKVYAARKNAKVCLSICEEYGSFDSYLWGFVGGKTIVNAWKSSEEVPTSTKESDNMSKDLKRRGMSFVGTTIVYAYMQAVGMVYDHIVDCWCYERDGGGHNILGGRM
jgi:DNA-3-methyladenine glycosylase I